MVNHLVDEVQRFAESTATGNRGQSDGDVLGDDWSSAYAEAAGALLGLAGCGRVPALKVVGQAVRVFGIDLTEGMLELTAAQLDEAGIRHAAVRVGDAGRRSFRLRRFDAVLGGFVMFLLPDPAGAVRAYRSLLADGRLAVSTYGREDERLTEAKAVLRQWAVPDSKAAGEDPLDSADGILRLLDLPEHLSDAQAEAEQALIEGAAGQVRLMTEIRYTIARA